MNCGLCYFGLMLYFLTSNTFSYETSSFSSTLDYRDFAAGKFKDILTDSCYNIGEQQIERRNTKPEFNNISRSIKTEDILLTLGSNFLTNRTTSSDHDDRMVEGVYKLHILPNGPVSGAVCLDGGAWCHDADTCYQRSSTALGSSTCFRHDVHLEGLLSNQVKYNPDFYNWTSVFVAYCDGASFTGNREKPLKVKNKLLYFRGRRILDAILDELLRRGIDNASEIILSGRSAGALAAIIHADYIRSRFRRVTNASFRVLADAGFFVDAPSLNGTEIIRSVFRQMSSLHNSSTSLNHACLHAQEREQEWRCFFPQNSLPFVASPVFLVNSLYDLWQIAYLSNIRCVLNIKTCNSTESFHIMKFREKTLHALRSVFDSSNETAVFADSCLVHTQCVMNALWTKIQVKNVTIAQAFANWYRGGDEDRFRIDCIYPCNLTCPKHYRIKRG
ncbi:hypothetical protein OS493_013319 [Desmophyllum pertusum]|uniref:Pectin acetylesterase n=1 Tax=Desmophyllum pertusum TaxID=174260 RepID=A0A9X0CGW9_9CNID|nr:hypothetical protein OS493_013319 [Desmophyllum pertusum]